MPEPRHQWIISTTRAQRDELVQGLALPTVLSSVSAHHNHRGPYTAVGAIVRAVVPTAQAELVHRHEVELLSVAPELRSSLSASRETLTSLAIPDERTRFYSRLRTLRLSHGIVEFLRDHLLATADGPRCQVVFDVSDADPTDVEFVAVALRRLDPRVLMLVVCTGTGALPAALADALRMYAEPVTGQSRPAQPLDAESRVLAASYISSDGADDRPELLAAYQALPAQDRAGLHDARADMLAALDETSLRLGAIPWHLERGSDPAGAGAEALRLALDYCIDMGYYDATVDFGARGRAVVDRAAQFELWWTFTTKMTTSLAALGRPDEAEELYDEVLTATDNPKVHMQVAYATGMIYTRHHDIDRRDHSRAKRLLHQAIAFAGVAFEGKERLFHTVFNRNGLALVETHLGNLPEALRLVSDGLAVLDRELAPDEHRLHRSVLRYNRAQVLVALGRLDEALADYEAVIEADPNYPEYHFDRANLLHRVGRDDEALAEYRATIALGPPFPEAYYNQAELWLDAGATDQALTGLSYVLELDPTFTDSYINRAGIHLSAGDHDAALADATAGLLLDPDNAYLNTVIGQVCAERQEFTKARAAFDRALAAVPDLVPALSGRAGVAHELGDARAAIDDLSVAVELAPSDAGLRYNLAIAYQSAQRWHDALTHLDTAAALIPDDRDIEEARRRCATARTSRGVSRT
ncbi:MAG TPA: tetratricopeptide repeat protein [Pseudonocardiaceae bacterium]|nr:tetratricopeptide repeat protein [Pseudonocardiaceae bacterium]